MENWKNTRAAKILQRTLKLYQDNGLSVYAGNATLFLITAIFPFMMLIILVINLIPGYSPADITDLLFKILPDLDSLHSLVQSIMTNLQNQSSGLLASVAVLTTLWSASAGVGAIQKGMNQLYPHTQGNAVKDTASRLFYTLILILLIPLVLVFEVLGDSLLGLIVNILNRIGFENAPALKVRLTSILQVSSLLIVIVTILVILMIYAYLPRGRHSLRSQIPGTIATAAGWIIFTQLFSFFIPRFYHSSPMYGSLASLFLALLWLRIIVMILFGGGALNRAIADQDASDRKRYAQPNAAAKNPNKNKKKNKKK